jgi:Tol biopolymer transport system component
MTHSVADGKGWIGGLPTTRVSVDSSGKQSVGWSGPWPAISADGRFVAFESWAGDLVANDTNGWSDIFVHDRRNGQTIRVSVDSNGAQGNGVSFRPSISADGQFIAFESTSTNLVENDTNGQMDVFVHDRHTGKTIRVSVDSSGQEGNDWSELPSLSADGSLVAFTSYATNLVANDTNGLGDVFVHDRATGETTRVSVDSQAHQAHGLSWLPGIDAEGRFIAFASDAADLVANDTNDRPDVFVHDRLTGETTRVSVDSQGQQGNRASGFECFPPYGCHSEPISISADGSAIAFMSLASNLVTGDTNNLWDTFVHDRVTGTTARVSVSSQGDEGDAESDASCLSGNGRLVAFRSYASNLVAGDTNASPDFFIHDRATGETWRASVSASGKQANDNSLGCSLSGDGRWLTFSSLATNLVVEDTNGALDIFVRDLIPGAQPVDAVRPLR